MAPEPTPLKSPWLSAKKWKYIVTDYGRVLKYVASIAFIAVILNCIVSYYWSPFLGSWLSGVAMLVVFAWALLYMSYQVAVLSEGEHEQKADDEVEDKTKSHQMNIGDEIFSRVLCEFLVSVIAGIALAHAIGILARADSPAHSRNVAKKEALEAESRAEPTSHDFFRETFEPILVDGLKGLALGVVLFLVPMLTQACAAAAKAASVAGGLKQVTDRLEQTTVDLTRALDAATLARAAATLLRLEDDHFLRTTTEVDCHASKAVEIYTGMIQSAAYAKKQLVQKLRDSNQKNLASDAWWNFMRSYYQEEVFDVANWEIATNVRNYAFSIISLIRSCLTSLQGTDSGLVVFNVSPFNPKDFYNWPSGTINNRRYHEAEFFAIYRRVFSQILELNEGNLLPMRVLLTAEGLADYDDTGKTTHAQDVDLGWWVDPTMKVGLDLARRHILPLPFSVAKHGFDNWNAIAEVPDLEAIKSMLLDRNRDRVIWSPFITNLNNVETTGINWAEKSLRKSYKERTERKEKQFGAFANYATWNKLIDERGTQAQIWTRELIGQWEKVRSHAQSMLNTVKGLTSNAPVSHADSSAQVLQDLQNTINDLLRSSSIDIAHVDRCHAADAHWRFAQLCGEHMDFEKDNPVPRSSFGTQLGPFEAWLLTSLIHEHGKKLASQCECKLVPLWSAFAYDFLGVRGLESANRLTDVMECMKSQFRICELPLQAISGQSNDPQVQMRNATHSQVPDQAHLHGEFVLLAVAPKNTIQEVAHKDTRAVAWWKDVKPIAMMTATMSDPLHTCHLALGFAGNSSNSTQKHFDWLKSMFLDSNVTVKNDEFLQWLQAEISNAS